MEEWLECGLVCHLNKALLTCRGVTRQERTLRPWVSYMLEGKYLGELTGDKGLLVGGPLSSGLWDTLFSSWHLSMENSCFDFTQMGEERKLTLCLLFS